MQILNLATPVFFHAQVSPERPALVVDDRVFTYEAFASVAGKVAAWVCLHTARRDRGPRVGIMAARSSETYAGIIGTAWAGGTYVPLNPKQPTARLVSIANRAGLDAVVVDRQGAPHLADLTEAVKVPVLAA